MQTFLPYPDFDRSASVLDRARLGKQRVETMQLMNAMLQGYLGNSSRGWMNHPAKRMWDGYAWALLQYQIAVINEWVHVRGYRDTCMQKTFDIYHKLPPELQREGEYPEWLGNDEFHQSHKSKLMFKKPDFYNFNVPNNLEYVWPV